jgi:23S rRNA (adenine2503-C2)-methyltransferase
MGEAPNRARQSGNGRGRKASRHRLFLRRLQDPARRPGRTGQIRWPNGRHVREASDGTASYQLRLADAEAVETVLIPEKDHYPLCLSTQVGCALGCTFCATGKMGFRRNLTPGEILGQILVARQWLWDRRSPLALRNLVFMAWASRFSLRQPACGPGGPAPLPGPGLLQPSHHRVQAGSSRICRRRGPGWVPGRLPARTTRRCGSGSCLGQTVPRDDLLAALKKIPQARGADENLRNLLLDGKNDSPGWPGSWCAFVPRQAKVNLIAFNPVPGLPYGRRPRIGLRLSGVLRQKGLRPRFASPRRGHRRACGQLRAEGATERPPVAPPRF